ncbi:superoxide dismutase [Cu-Zn]-like [Oratosquilla oratoria]|uniref:superoxide dismutase [Cu-Zn]-like n=1 Tax=Oratosquilla oratoria TaxID=337810 RepID=UPI003F774C58
MWRLLPPPPHWYIMDGGSASVFCLWASFRQSTPRSLLPNFFRSARRKDIMARLAILMAAVTLLGAQVTSSPRRAAARSVVHVGNTNVPSLLYINAAPGNTVVEKRTGSSDIIQLFLYPATKENKNEAKIATAVLKGDVLGVLTFTQLLPPVGNTTIKGTLAGLTPGKHGFHIHEKGDLSKGCISAGGHYNPYMRDHGAPEDTERHVGDLGNIEVDETGTAVVDIVDNMITLVGPRSIVGRAIVIHAGVDDLGKGGHPDSLTTGNAGGRVDCAVIGYA